jgi:hypothetical protein
MNQHQYDSLKDIIHEVENDHTKLLIMMDEADEGEPYIKIPLGDSKVFDGYMVIHPQGWFLVREEEKT